MDINEEIMMDDIAILSVRLGGLLEVLSELGMECELHMDGEGIPAVLGRLGERLFHFSYILAGDTEDTFILTAATLAGDIPAEEESEGFDISKVLLCDSFNRNSDFGFAVYHPEENVVELRAQTVEKGGLSDPEFYRTFVGMLEGSVEELLEEE